MSQGTPTPAATDASGEGGFIGTPAGAGGSQPASSTSSSTGSQTPGTSTGGRTTGGRLTSTSTTGGSTTAGGLVTTGGVVTGGTVTGLATGTTTAGLSSTTTSGTTTTAGMSTGTSTAGTTSMTGTTTSGTTTATGTTTSGTTTMGMSTGTSTGGTNTAGTTGSPGASEGSATLNGSVGGMTFVPQSATWVMLGQQVVITLWEQPQACSLVSGGTQPRGGRATFVLMSYDGTHVVAPVPQTYTVEPKSFKPTAAGFYTAVTLDSLDTKCNSTIPAKTGQASSKTVTLTSVGAAYSGFYDVGFTGSDAVNGTFNAINCPAAASNGPFVCQP